MSLDSLANHSIELIHQLNSVDGETYQSLLPQPSVWQFGLIKMGWLTERWRSLAATACTRTEFNPSFLLILQRTKSTRAQ